MKKNCVITLGSKMQTPADGGQEVEVPNTYTIRPLTLTQSRDVGVGMFPETPDTLAGNFDFNFEQAMGVILAALARDYPEATREKLLAMEIPWPDLDAARNKILEYSGFRKAAQPADPAGGASGAPSPGEAAPGAA